MSVTIPETSNELRKAGFEYDRDAKCRRCEGRGEWWISPSGGNIFMDVTKRDPLKSAEEVRTPHRCG